MRFGGGLYWVERLQNRVGQGLIFHVIIPAHYTFCENVVTRSSRLQMLFKVSVPKNFAIFIEKHLCWSFELLALTPATFSCEYCEIFKFFFLQNTFGGWLFQQAGILIVVKVWWALRWQDLSKRKPIPSPIMVKWEFSGTFCPSLALIS